MKNPFKQMKQVQGAMAVMMHEVYLAGIEDGATGAGFPSLRDFSMHAKEISTRGKAIAINLHRGTINSGGGAKNGRGETVTTDEKKSS